MNALIWDMEATVKFLTCAWNEYARLIGVVVLNLLVVCFGVGASAAQGDLKAGASYEKQGQFFRAAEAYCKALRLKPRDQKARQALERTADRAIEEQLRNAEALAAELKTDRAIVELDSAARFLERLAEFGIEPQDAHDIAARKEDLVSRRVQALLAEAESARADGLWSAAIAQLQKVDALRPGSDDTRDRLHDMWASWGDTNLREGRLRAAVERYEQAVRVPGARSIVAAARAAAIRIGLAESAIRRGACRSAVADLRKAEQLAAGSVRPELLGRATSCAATCVRLSVTADRDSGVTDVARDLLGAEVRKQIGAEASEFLRLLPSGSAGAPACDGRTMPGVDGEPMNVGPYSAVVRVTAINITRQPASSVTRQTRVSHGLGVDTLATYEEYRETLTGAITGWVTLTDQRAAVTSVPLPLPLRAIGQSTALWERSPLSTITTEDVFTRQRATVVSIDVADRGKAQADKARLQARSDLNDTLIRKLATGAAQRLLSTLDVEPAVPDPSDFSSIDLPWLSEGGLK